MAVTKFSKNMAIISALDDEPNDVGGLTASELKAKFDEGGEALKTYINGTLIPAVETEQSKVTTLQSASHTHSNKALLDTYTQTEANIKDAVSKKHSHSNKSVLDGIAGVTQELGAATDKIPSEAAVSAAIAGSGNIPGGGTTGQVLMKNSDTTHDMKWNTLDVADVGGKNKNFLHNWDFRTPINTLGKSTYSGAVQGTIDRWRTSNANTNVNVNTKSITIAAASSSNTPYLLQTLCEQNALMGKQVTLSVLMSDGTLKTASSTLPTAMPSSTTSYANTGAGHILVMGGVMYVRLAAAQGGSNTYTAVKLELGGKSTLTADDSADKAEQEAICCQYDPSSGAYIGMNYLPLTGGSMSGNLTIAKSIPGVTLSDKNNGAGGSVFVTNDRLYLQNANVSGSNENRRQLIVCNSDAVQIANALVINDVVNGTSTVYNVLHQGNAANLGYSKIITGTYSGSGKYGSSNANTLTPGWAPRAMIVYSLSSTMYQGRFMAVFIKGQKGVSFYGDTVRTGFEAVNASLMSSTTWGTTNISWYGASAVEQLNYSGQTYGYIIFG